MGRAIAFLVVSALAAVNVLLPAAKSAARAIPTSVAKVAREDFSFIYGRWLVHNRRLKESLTDREDWTEFDANLVCVPVMNGLGNVDEMRQLDGTPMGSALRTYDIARHVWSDYWVTAREGVDRKSVV